MQNIPFWRNTDVSLVFTSGCVYHLGIRMTNVMEDVYNRTIMQAK